MGRYRSSRLSVGDIGGIKSHVEQFMSLQDVAGGNENLSVLSVISKNAAQIANSLFGLKTNTSLIIQLVLLAA
jgi:hypothetical protein